MKYNHLKKIIVVFFATVLIGSACVLPTMAATTTIQGCNSQNLDDVAKYYGYMLDDESIDNIKYISYDDGKTLYIKDLNIKLSCDSKKEKEIGFKTVLLQYIDPIAKVESSVYHGNGKDFKIVNQMIVATNADLDANDIAMDIRNGQFIVSGTLHSDTDAWNMIYDSFQKIIVGITGVGILICLLAFTLQFIKLGSVADNPSERAKVLKGIVWSGVGTAGCGAATLIFGITFGLI